MKTSFQFRYQGHYLQNIAVLQYLHLMIKINPGMTPVIITWKWTTLMTHQGGMFSNKTCNKFLTQTLCLSSISSCLFFAVKSINPENDTMITEGELWKVVQKNKNGKLVWKVRTGVTVQQQGLSLHFPAGGLLTCGSFILHSTRRQHTGVASSLRSIRKLETVIPGTPTGAGNVLKRSLPSSLSCKCISCWETGEGNNQHSSCPM